MKKLTYTLIMLGFIVLNSQAQIIGGPCEGCEALLEYGNKQLTAVDTLPEFETTQPQMVVTGTVYQSNGKTPASGVIVYAYHTNRDGIYPTKGNEKGWARRHGYIRGWTKTGEDGRYTFYTFRPETYPSRSEPAHVHLTIKEPNKQEYWIDSILFEGDPLITEKVRKSKGSRCGSGIIELQQKDGYLIANRDIHLGLNIPNYY
ncbi:intradiol ring-cleavage dioxygenase [Roseivirga pacifica]|uniref:dioxygenase family protein n=1 Tax=Roseivirga pacifica TaxID=1267423 RepID=UPI003BAE21B6